MKKLWTKFKHWLIKKLGGYVKEPMKPTYQYYGSDVITLQASVKANSRDWYGYRVFKYDQPHDLEAKSEEFKERVMEDLKRQMADCISEHWDTLAQVDTCDMFDEDRVLVRATVRIVESGVRRRL